MKTKERYYIGAYWPSRKESIEDCADRITLLLDSLSAIDSMFSQWFMLKKHKNEKDLKFEVNRENIMIILNKGRCYNYQKIVMPELGFAIGLWDGQGDESIVINFACGSYSNNNNIGNCCVIRLPVSDIFLKNLSHKAIDIIKTIVVSMDPQWAVWTSDQIRDNLDVKTGEPMFGWITYLSNHYSINNKIMSPSRIETMSTGSIVISSEYMSSINIPNSIALINSLQRKFFERKDL